MFSDEVMGYMLSNAHKLSMMQPHDPPVKANISQKEALEIFNELIEVYQRHNVSYQCACRLSMALNEAFITGAVELYRREQNNPIGFDL